MMSSGSELNGTFQLDPKEEAVSRFVHEVGLQLQEAFIYRNKTQKFTQQDIAAFLGVNRSQINRWLSGYSNLTLESVALMSLAMGAVPSITIKLEDVRGNAVAMSTSANTAADQQSNQVITGSSAAAEVFA